MPGCTTLKSLQVQHVPSHRVHILLSCAQYNKYGRMYNAQHQTMNHALIEAGRVSPSTFWRNDRRLPDRAYTPSSELFWTDSTSHEQELKRTTDPIPAAIKLTILRSQETSKWLQTPPMFANGTYLCEMKFRDALHHRYRRKLPNLPVSAMVVELNSP